MEHLRGFTITRNAAIPPIVRLDNVDDLELVSRWSFAHCMRLLEDSRFLNAIDDKLAFSKTLKYHYDEFWTRTVYAFLHDFYYELEYEKNRSVATASTGSFVTDFNSTKFTCWFRLDPSKRYSLAPFSQGESSTAFYVKSLLYYHFLLQTCYAFNNRLLAMTQIHGEGDIDGAKEEFFNHPAHLASLHSLNGHFELQLPQNSLEKQQLDNLCRKMIDLGGNNDSPRFGWRRITLVYEALEIHDPSTTVTMIAKASNQIIRCDRISNDVYRQSTLTINGYRINS